MSGKTTMFLSPEDLKQLHDAVKSPPKPNKKLRKAQKEYKKRKNASKSPVK